MLADERKQILHIEPERAPRPPFAVTAPEGAAISEHEVVRWGAGRPDPPVADRIAEETPVGLVYNEHPYAVMMATPRDLSDFGLGFSLAEGILAHADELEGLELLRYPNGLELQLSVPAARAAALGGLPRQLAGRTGCGLCGAATLAQALNPPPPVRTRPPIPLRAVTAGLAALPDHQGLNAATGALHAAAWIDLQGRVRLVREDVGRHNALDKLIGALARSGTDRREGLAIVTSRASYELVQKAAHAGIGALAAVSAPTGLAIRMAEAAGVLLLGFVRGERLVAYTHAARLRG